MVMYENKLNVKDDHRAPRTLTILETTRDKEPVTRNEDTDKAQSSIKVPTDGRNLSTWEGKVTGRGSSQSLKGASPRLDPSLQRGELHVGGGHVTTTSMREDETKHPLLFRSRDRSLFLNAKAQDPKIR